MVLLKCFYGHPDESSLIRCQNNAKQCKTCVGFMSQGFILLTFQSDNYFSFRRDCSRNIQMNKLNKLIQSQCCVILRFVAAVKNKTLHHCCCLPHEIQQCTPTYSNSTFGADELEKDELLTSLCHKPHGL